MLKRNEFCSVIQKLRISTGREFCFVILSWSKQSVCNIFWWHSMVLDFPRAPRKNSKNSKGTIDDVGDEMMIVMISILYDRDK